MIYQKTKKRSLEQEVLEQEVPEQEVLEQEVLQANICFRFSHEIFKNDRFFAKFSSPTSRTPKCKKRPEFCVLKTIFGTLLIWASLFN
jgi:hypothetical protein